ncbi:hypothetical protein BH11PSE11_BH11PSE11_36380 [soil metagenome]
MNKKLMCLLAFLFASNSVLASDEMNKREGSDPLACDKEVRVREAPASIASVSALRKFAESFDHCYLHRFYYQSDSLISLGQIDYFVLFEAEGSGWIKTSAHVYFCNKLGCGRLAFRKLFDSDLTVHFDEKRKILEIRKNDEIVLAISVASDLRTIKAAKKDERDNEMLHASLAY